MTDKEFRVRITELLIADGYIEESVDTEKLNEVLYKNLLNNVMKHGKIWLRYFKYNEKK